MDLSSSGAVLLSLPMHKGGYTLCSAMITLMPHLKIGPYKEGVTNCSDSNAVLPYSAELDTPSPDTIKLYLSLLLLYVLFYSSIHFFKCFSFFIYSSEFFRKPQCAW